MTRFAALAWLCALLGVGPLSATGNIGAAEACATTDGGIRIDSVIGLSQKPFPVERRRTSDVKEFG